MSGYKRRRPGISFSQGFREEDLQDKLEHEPNKVRSNTKISSRHRGVNGRCCYCAATFHVSRRNAGRKPRITR